MSTRTYSESEIKRLMERAAQLQASADSHEPDGLTLPELEQIAAEAGIDPQFLRAAARETETGVGLHDVAGQNKTHVFVERTVPGTLSDAEWEEVVLRLRKQFSSDLSGSFGMGPQYGPGITETLGKTREWRHTTSMGVATTATVRSLDGQQHIRIQRRVGLGSPRAEGIGYGAILALASSGILMPLLSMPPPVFLPVLILLFFAFWPLVEWLDRRWRMNKLEEVEEVVADIAQIIHNPEAQSREALPEATRQNAIPQLDLDALDLDPVDVPHRPLRKRDRS